MATDVARSHVRDVRVAGSNPVTPTIDLRVYSGLIGNVSYRSFEFSSSFSP